MERALVSEFAAPDQALGFAGLFDERVAVHAPN